MSNLGQNNPINVSVGDTIQFSVKDLNDTSMYSGTVVSICDYTSARAYSDVAATHQAMLAADATLPDVELMRFIVVECYDGVRRPYAYASDGTNSWFTNNQVEISDVGAEYSIKIYNCQLSDANLAIRVLREQGIVCKLIDS